MQASNPGRGITVLVLVEHFGLVSIIDVYSAAAVSWLLGYVICYYWANNEISVMTASALAAMW